MNKQYELTNKVKKIAHQVGFDLVGIASPKAIPEAILSYNNWLSKNMNANMNYLSKNIERRTKPKKIMPNAKSIICFGINYFQSDITKLIENQGVIARYARGKDYHRMIEKKLKSFISLANESLKPQNINWKYYVDYGPILERAYAQQAGLGFIGRNKNLITKEFGSWIFLSTIITDLKLDYDTPTKFGCGKCRACIDACPVGALIKENPNEFDKNVILNANKCISYQTIENKNNNIPESTSKKMNNRIFGCDICQEVCPWNKSPVETKHEALLSKNGAGESINLNEILNMNEEEFLEKYKGTSVMRAKFKGMRRNAEAVVENNKESIS